MYLYEKQKSTIDVYELKENQKKLIEFKRREMAKKSKNDIVYKFLLTDADGLKGIDYLDAITNVDIISHEKKIQKSKELNGKTVLQNLSCENLDDKIIIDGLLEQYYKGDLENSSIKKLMQDGVAVKYLLLTTYTKHVIKKESLLFNGIYELPYILSLPESLVLLRELRNKIFNDICDKNIYGQLATFDFVDEPIASYDIETINCMINFGLLNQKINDNDFDIHQKILNKVRQVNK